MSELTDFVAALWPQPETLPPACLTIIAAKKSTESKTGMQRIHEHVRLDPSAYSVSDRVASLFTTARLAPPELIERAALAFDAEGADVYFSVAATTPGLSKYHRGTRAQLVALPGFAMDFDVAGDGHQSQALPENEETVIAEYLAKVTPWPTRVHRTAGGLHAFWLFDRPLIFGTSTKEGFVIEEIQKLSEQWQALFQAIAQSRGEHLDSTADLTRILRLPGTHNHKLDDRGVAPRPVTVAYGNGERVTLDQLRETISKSGVVVSKPSIALGSPDVASVEYMLDPWTPERTREELPKLLRQHAAKNEARRPIIKAFLSGEPYSAGGEHHAIRQQLVSWIAWMSKGCADVGVVCEMNQPCYEKRDAPPDAYEKFETQLVAALQEAGAKQAIESERLAGMVKAFTKTPDENRSPQRGRWGGSALSVSPPPIGRFTQKPGNAPAANAPAKSKKK